MRVTRRRFLQALSAVPALTTSSLASVAGEADESPLFTFVVDADPHMSIGFNLVHVYSKRFAVEFIPMAIS